MKRFYPRHKETDLVTCRNLSCGYTDEAWYFGVKERKKGTYMYPIYHQTCPICRDTEDDKTKAKDRSLSKARDITRRKAAKFKVSKNDLIEIFGWPTIEEIAQEIKDIYAGGCHYCRKPYEIMGHGFQDVTIDQRDPYAKEPYWDMFVFCCGTCNRRKGQMLPERWAAWLAKARRNAEWSERRMREVSRPRLIPDTVAQANTIIQTGDHQLPLQLNQPSL